MGNAHKIVAACHGQQGGKIFNIVLICLHVVCIAAIAAHGDARELAHEVILQACSCHLAGIVEILGADETHHRIDQEGRKPLGKAVAPCLHGHLVGAMVGLAGQLRTLPGLKIHHIRPFRRALTEQQVLRLRQGGSIEAEGRIALFRACDGLEDQIAGRTRTHRLHLRRHMRQHANLGRDLPMLLDLLKSAQHLAHLLRGVGNGIQTDDRIACAEGQTLQHGSGDAVGVIGGVVWLQTAAECAGQTDGSIAVGGDGQLCRCIDQIQVAHQLAHCRHHLRGQTTAESAQRRGFLREDVFPQLRHRPVLNLAVDGFVHIILDDAGDLVLLIGNNGILPQILQRQRRQHHLCRHTLLGGSGSQTCQLVAGFFFVGLCQNLFDRGELISFPQKGGL